MNLRNFITKERSLLLTYLEKNDIPAIKLYLRTGLPLDINENYYANAKTVEAMECLKFYKVPIFKDTESGNFEEFNDSETFYCTGFLDNAVVLWKWLLENKHPLPYETDYLFEIPGLEKKNFLIANGIKPTINVLDFCEDKESKQWLINNGHHIITREEFDNNKKD